MNEPLKILWKFPCRGRVDLFFKSLDSLNDNIRDRNNYLISLTIDTDDVILNTPEVIERINTYPNTSIEWGLSKSKIDAVNRSMPNYDWDVCIVWSNDMVCTFFGMDDIMRADMYNIINNHDDDFLIHYPEQDAREFLNVLLIVTRKYYNRFNYLYHPSYLSLWCDNETMCVSKMLGRYHYVGTPSLYVHENAAYHQYNLKRDELFNEQQSHWAVDEANFHERRKRNFDLKEDEIVDKFYLSKTFPYT
ncbi:MAG: hypothetical protein V4547_17030 [Bacteroidota bacterium]